MFQIVIRAEAEIVILILRSGIDPPTLFTAEGAFLRITGHNILAQLGPDRFEPVAKVAHDGEVPQDRPFALRDVIDKEADEQRGREIQDPHVCVPGRLVACCAIFDARSGNQAGSQVLLWQAVKRHESSDE